jgi:hypothetical protein
MSKLTESRYRTMVRTLRASLVNEKDCLYFAHTSQGVINVITWNYLIPGFVVITGEDESEKYRFLVFSDEAACSFPLEVKRKKQKGSGKTLGFKPASNAGLEEKA